MMGRVGRALVWHELVERLRDRWVLVISILFALLASAVSLYGASAEGAAATVTGPSLVTLASLLVPLVAVVLGHDAIVGERERNTLGLLLSLPVSKPVVVGAKFVGRMMALTVAVGVGIGAAVLVAGEGQGAVLAQLLLPTLLLGAAFLSIGILISSATTRHVTATSIVVAVWFIMVFFWDLGLLGLLVVTDGQVGQDTIGWLMWSNPAGLFRVEMMEQFAGPEVLEGLGMTAGLPNDASQIGLWVGWILGPLAISALLLARKKVSS
ncbi:MAG: Cu-processing system permease protein [Myxococcota bacterium]|jgi:Cu-processing system permease protein